MSEEANVKAVEKVLGEPVFLGFDENTHRIRRNLLIVASLSLIYKFQGLELVVKESSILGLRFNGLTSEGIDTILSILISYHLVHFLWASWDAFVEWRLRLTGTRDGFKIQGSTQSIEGDYHPDPRQSTLFSWWTDQAKSLSRTHNTLNDIKDYIKDIETHREKLQSRTPEEDYLKNILSRLPDLQKHIKKDQDILTSQRIPVSLDRFENWFKWFQISQGLRWITMEFGIPAVLGLWAIELLMGWGTTAISWIKTILN